MLIGTDTICGIPIENLTLGSEKKVRLQCDICKTEWIAIYHNYTQGQKRKNFSGETFCRKCCTQKAANANRGKPSFKKGKRQLEVSGPNSPSWKGGTYISSDGYRMIYVRNDSPTVSTIKWSNYVKEHIAVMENLLQRELTSSEVIHHIDGDKLNNEIDNLLLCSSDKQHRQLHNQLERFTMELVRAKVIVFNKTTNQYEMADVKLRELLEHPEEDNQQPSLGSNSSEGSETRLNDPI